MRLSNRLQTKHRLMVMNNHVCEWCEKNPASDMHEIVSRSMTRKGSLTRDLTYDERLCCVLCRGCHDKAHGKKAREVLLAIKVERHGDWSVAEALSNVAESMIRKLSVEEDLENNETA